MVLVCDVDDSSRFARTLREAMKKRRYSARELALAVGMSPSYLTRVLAGERNPPSEAVITKIAQVLGLNADLLLWEANRLPMFLRAGGPLNPEDLEALRESYERLRHRRSQTGGRRTK